MSTISGISGSTTDQNLATRDTAKTMKEDFMQLLVAQLQHQDPMSPMEAMEFTSQLSQFAELEQMFYMNENLEYLQNSQASINNIQAASFIGKVVKARGDIVSFKDGQVQPMSYRLGEKAASVNVKVINENGNVVRSYEVGKKDEGIHTLQWDGRDAVGNLLPDGDYQFEISAKGIDDEKIRVLTYIEGQITGVTFENAIPLLHIGSIRVPLGDVYEVLEGEEGEAPAAPPQSTPDPDSSPQQNQKVAFRLPEPSS